MGNSECIPFRIKTEVAEGSERFGGHTPSGISPRLSNELTQYLLTLDFVDDLQLSLFVSLDVDLWAERMGTVVSPAPDTFDCVVHAAAKRGAETAFQSKYPEGSIHRGPPQLDDPTEPYADHKVGGFPVFFGYGADAYQAAALLLKNGYYPLLQLCFPSSDDLEIDEDWLFGEEPFHLFFKVIDGEYEFRAMW